MGKTFCQRFARIRQRFWYLMDILATKTTLYAFILAIIALLLTACVFLFHYHQKAEWVFNIVNYLAINPVAGQILGNLFAVCFVFLIAVVGLLFASIIRDWRNADPDKQPSIQHNRTRNSKSTAIKLDFSTMSPAQIDTVMRYLKGYIQIGGEDATKETTEDKTEEEEGGQA